MAERGIIFRVDAGPTIGIGHLRRCLTLAAELRERDCHVRFVCKDRFGPDLESLVAQYAIQYLADADRNTERRDAEGEELWDADATLAVVGPSTTAESWAVVDNYRLGHRWERRMRGAGYRIVAIDDYRDRRHHADLLTGDAEAPFDPDLNELASTGRTLVGPRYAIVDPAYAFSGLDFKATGSGKRLLVSYGGSDPTGETSKALKAIQALKTDDCRRVQVETVDVVAGLADPSSAAIVRAGAAIPDVIVHRRLSSLEPLMRRADLVLTSGGNTMVEALALRKPCIVTVTGDNQAMTAGKLDAVGVIRSLGHHASVTPDAVLEMIARALGDFDAFARRVAAEAPFDHLGSRRIAAAMLA